MARQEPKKSARAVLLNRGDGCEDIIVGMKTLSWPQLGAIDVPEEGMKKLATHTGLRGLGRKDVA
jgi:hypothetical protein